MRWVVETVLLGHVDKCGERNLANLECHTKHNPQPTLRSEQRNEQTKTLQCVLVPVPVPVPVSIDKFATTSTLIYISIYSHIYSSISRPAASLPLHNKSKLSLASLSVSLCNAIYQLTHLEFVQRGSVPV